MRKSFNTYLIIWVIALVLFNLVIFVIPSTMDGKTIIEVAKFISYIRNGSIDIFKVTAEDIANGLVIDIGTIQKGLDFDLVKFAEFLLNSTDKELILYKYAGAFWPSYACIMFAFVGQLICAIFAFKETNNQKFFYKIPLITISYAGLVFTLIFGIIGMFFPNFPIWLAIAICTIIFVITLIAVLKANLTSFIISSKDDEILESTAFIRKMTEKAKSLYDQNKDNDGLRRAYEEFKYANIINNACLETINDEVLRMFDSVEKNPNEETINKLIQLIKKRNEMAKH